MHKRKPPISGAKIDGRMVWLSMHLSTKAASEAWSKISAAFLQEMKTRAFN
jgi:hypothetical protein